MQHTLSGYQWMTVQGHSRLLTMIKLTWKCIFHMLKPHQSYINYIKIIIKAVYRLYETLLWACDEYYTATWPLTNFAGNYCRSLQTEFTKTWYVSYIKMTRNSPGTEWYIIWGGRIQGKWEIWWNVALNFLAGAHGKYWRQKKEVR